MALSLLLSSCGTEESHDIPPDCFTYYKINEWYRETYGKDLGGDYEKTFENAPRHRCFLDNPFADNVSVKGDGKIWQVYDPELLKIVWEPDGTVDFWTGDVIYCQKLPCPQ